MTTIEYITDKFNLTYGKKQPLVEIPNVNRQTLASLFAELHFNVGAEVGVLEGSYSKILCESNPQLHLFCIDPWTIHSEYKDITTQKKLERVYNTAVERLAPYNCEIIRKFSADAVTQFKDESLDFVYIDASHEFRQVVDDIALWSKKVKKGGIVSGHDYIRRKTGPYLVHVVDAVNGYTSAYNIRPIFTLGRKGYAKGELRDKPMSWMWIKS